MGCVGVYLAKDQLAEESRKRQSVFRDEFIFMASATEGTGSSRTASAAVDTVCAGRVCPLTAFRQQTSSGHSVTGRILCGEGSEV